MTMDQRDRVLRGYKKRERALQNRISMEHLVNKRLILLLSQCYPNLKNGPLKDSVEHEIKMTKYKYCRRK